MERIKHILANGRTGHDGKVTPMSPREWIILMGVSFVMLFIWTAMGVLLGVLSTLGLLWSTVGAPRTSRRDEPPSA